MSGPIPPGPDTSSAYSCIRYTLYGTGDRDNAKAAIADMKIVLHAKGLNCKGKKAELTQRVIDNRAFWGHEHEGGGASTSPPATCTATETAPLRSDIIEVAQTPNTSAPPTEATPEVQNKSSTHPSTQP